MKKNHRNITFVTTTVYVQEEIEKNHGKRKIDLTSRSNSQYRRDITKAQNKRLPDHDKSAD